MADEPARDMIGFRPNYDEATGEDDDEGNIDRYNGDISKDEGEKEVGGTAVEDEDLEQLAEEAYDIATKVVLELGLVTKLLNIEFLASGGYNRVWRVKCILEPTSQHARSRPEIKDFVLRVARKESPLQPYRLRNEVACLQFLAAKVPGILAPRVFALDDGSSPSSGPAFLFEDFIEGQRLSVVWPNLSESQKWTVLRQIASTVADLGETRFSMIGGLTLGGIAGPTIEAAKLFNGRASYHSPQYYDIGPYSSSKAYILACFDREIYYYSHAPASELEGFEDVFTDISISAFIERLQHERNTLATQDSSVFEQIDAEPHVLVHEDFHAGNMLVHEGHLAGIVDWEFSGTYPLSELVGFTAILQISGPADERDDITEQEEDRWHARYLKELEHVVKERGWKDKDVSTLMSDGHHLLHKARSIMFPEQRADDEEEK